MAISGKWINLNQKNDVENWDDLVDPIKKDLDEKSEDLNNSISADFKSYVSKMTTSDVFFVQFVKELKEKDLDNFEESAFD
jgi:hypothetical protein